MTGSGMTGSISLIEVEASVGPIDMFISNGGVGFGDGEISQRVYRDV